MALNLRSFSCLACSHPAILQGSLGFWYLGVGLCRQGLSCSLFHLLSPSLGTTQCKVNLPAILVKVASFFARCVRLRALILPRVSVLVRLGQDIEHVPDPTRPLEPEQGSQSEQGTEHANGTSGDSASSNEGPQSVTCRRRK